MKFRIHYTIDGMEDSIMIEGASVEECQKQAQKEVEKRKARDPWSEEITEQGK